MVDPELFIRPDGLPMAFLMSYKGTQTQTVKQLVEERGGAVLDQPSLVYRDNIVKLLVGGEVSLRRDLDNFDYRYVLDCVKEDMILPNLLDYRINAHLPSILQQYDPVDVLLGYKRWRDMAEVEGEKVSDIDDGRPVVESNSKQKVFKSFRMPYTKEDQIEIVNFLVSHSAYKVVKGNSIWERMEGGGLCKGVRTWQSMKEHFRKKIIPEIHSFGLSWKQVRRFRAAFGLDQEQEQESEEEEEVQEERIEEEKNKPRPHSEKRLDQVKPRRTSSPKGNPDKIVDETHSDNDADDETIDVIVSAEEEEDISVEVKAMQKKRKLYSRDVSFLYTESEGGGLEFNVPPVKKRRVSSDIVENDESMEAIQLDDLDTVVVTSVDLNEAINIDDVEKIDNFETESKNTKVNEDIASCDKTSTSSLSEGTNICDNLESLEDIFDVEDDISTSSNLHPAKSKSAPNTCPSFQFGEGSKNGILSMPSPRKSVSSESDYFINSPTSTNSTRSTPPLKDKYVPPCALNSSSTDPQNVAKSTSPLKDMPGSTSHYRNNVSKSTSPLNDGPGPLTEDISSPISKVKDLSKSTSLLTEDDMSASFNLLPAKMKSLRYSRSVKVQPRKSPLNNVSLSTSPLKDKSVSAVLNISRSSSSLKDISRSTSPLKNVSKSTTHLKEMSMSTSPLKYTKSVKVQLRKLVLKSPRPLCSQGMETVTGRVRGEGCDDTDTGSDCLDADKVDEAISPKDTKAVKKNSAATSFTKTKSAKAEREVWYTSRFKQPYSRVEEEAVVNYFLRYGGYSVRGGNAVWQKMEEDWICPGRTWQSLRERFGKSIEKNLEQFGVSKTRLEEVDRNMEVSSMEGRVRKKARGLRQNANYYSREEDLKIIKFIAENKRFDDVRGKEVWQVMEEGKVVKGRSWQSMKERFRKVISERIRTYGLSQEIVRGFGGFGGKKKEKKLS